MQHMTKNLPIRDIGPIPEFVDSIARNVLQNALRRARKERGVTLKDIATRLGIRQATVISHMATGRIGIPVDRAPEIAKILEIDPVWFTKLVLKQRHRTAMNAIGIDKLIPDDRDYDSTSLAITIAEHSADHARVMSEVARDIAPGERWLSVSELELMQLIRRLRPEVSTSGLSTEDMNAIQEAIDPKVC